jgi:WD40 repeat protein/transcriptional regulator with XRE-family HTH domain
MVHVEESALGVQNAARLLVDVAGFAGLALRFRGRTGLTQREVAARLGIHVRSVQLWESGASHPSPHRLQGLISVFVDAGGFTDGDERDQADALWASAEAESNRLKASFDHTWFTGLLIERASRSDCSASSPTAKVRARQHWGDAPDVAGFLGRVAERELLRRWIIDGGSRVVALTGLGGIGKSVLAARAAQDLAPRFEHVYWRGLRNAPAFDEWVAGAIGYLSAKEARAGESHGARLERLLDLLREVRCLLVLDNFETVLQPGVRIGGYRPGYEGYGALLRRLAESPHQSCLLLTSREEPLELGPLKGEKAQAQVLALSGLDVSDGQALLRDKGLHGDLASWEELVTRYAGNGLALKVVGESIRELFDGAISAYVADIGASHGALFGGVRQLLDTQVQRLSDLEHRLLRWLSVEREPVSFSELAADIGPGVGRGDVREAVEALRHRSLLERSEQGARFTPHSVVLEYVTDQLVEDVAQELTNSELVCLRIQPLLRATARDYVRRSQERLLAGAVLDRLIARLGSPRAADRRLVALLDRLREMPLEEQGYAPGNVANLLRLLRGDLRRVDLSALAVRQVYLQGVEAQDASLVGAHVSESVLTEAIHYICVALSPDGTRMLTGSSTGEVCLWRVADRTRLHSMAGHAGPIMTVALSEDGRIIGSASQDGTVRLWQAENGRPLATLRGHTSLVQGAAMGSSGNVIASASQDGTVKLWDTAAGHLLRTLEGQAGGVLAVALSRDASLVVGGTQEGTVLLWEVSTGLLTATLVGHTDAVPGVALSGDGRLLASASHDGTARLWDVARGELLTTLRGHTGGVWDVALSADGRLIATSSQDGTVRLWAADDGAPLATFHGHRGGVWDVALSADGQLVASGSQDGTVRLWETGSGRLLESVQGHTDAIWDVALSKDGQLVASASQDGTATLWETASGRPLVRLRGHFGGIQGIALSSDGQLVASGSHDGTVRLWDSRNGQLRASLTGHRGAIWDVTLSEDGQLLASGGYDGTIKLWDAVRGELVTTLYGHTSGVRGVALNRARGLLASGSQDGTVNVWNVATEQLLNTLRGHTGGVVSVSLSENGQFVASGSFDGTVRLWDTVSGSCLRTIQAHAGGALCVTLAKDGSLLASAGFDQNVRVWEAQGGRAVATLSGHAGAVWGIALSEDRKLLCSGSFDGTVKLWDVQSGNCLRTLRAERPYERMDITRVTGLTDADRAVLLALGAVESRPLEQKYEFVC